MNFFANELRKVFLDEALISEPSFVGRSCYGYLGKDLRVRAEFVAPRIVDHYDALKISILNRTNGVVDTISLRFKDLLGRKSVPNNPNFPNGVDPYIWVYREQAEWYAYHPSTADYEVLRNAAKSYLDVFRPRENEHECSSLDDRLQSAQSKNSGSFAREIDGAELSR